MRTDRWRERALAWSLLAACSSGCVTDAKNPPDANAGATGGAASVGNMGMSSRGTGGQTSSPMMAAMDAGTRGSAPAPDSGLGTDAGRTIAMAGSRDSHYPLVDGATWDYHHTKPTKPDWDEHDSMRATTYHDAPAFILEDQEDEQGVQTHSTLAVDGSSINRVYQEESVAGQVALTVTYDPPFLRFDEAWMQAAESVTLTDKWTRTCLVGGTAASNCATGAVTPGMTTHKYTVIDVAAKITVPAGSFEAIEIERVDPDTNETKQYWFVAGIGKVRDENPATQAITELTSYTIP
jgi:hypothetical protein